MGFFKDFKNDMKQAVNELIPGNDEMVNEYDDEDMVNTLEEDTGTEDGNYVNTMEDEPVKAESTGTEEDELLEDVDLADLEDFDLEDEDLEDNFTEHTSPEEFAKSVVNNIKAESTEDHSKDMNSMAEMPAEKTAAADIGHPEEAEELQKAAKSEPEHSAIPTKESEPLLKEPEAADGTKEKETPLINQEELPMAEDKIIEITAKKEIEKPASSVEETPIASEDISDSTTYITKGTRIEGNLFTDGSVDIIGTVEGDVSCYGKLVVSGVINGKINASEIYANAAKINGEITSAGSVKIGVGSVIVGNVEAESAVIAGAINGDLDIKGPVIVDSTAVIMGNIKSRSVQINNGAVIEGFCSQSYSDIDVKSFFA